MASLKTIICGVRGWWPSSSGTLTWLSGTAPGTLLRWGNVGLMEFVYSLSLYAVAWLVSRRINNVIFRPFFRVCKFQGSLQKHFQGLCTIDLHPKRNILSKFERNRRDPLAHILWYSQTCSPDKVKLSVCYKPLTWPCTLWGWFLPFVPFGLKLLLPGC